MSYIDIMIIVAMNTSIVIELCNSDSMARIRITVIPKPIYHLRRSEMLNILYPFLDYHNYIY